MNDTTGCLGKISYSTRAKAEEAKRHLLKKTGYVKGGGGHSAQVPTAYCCAKCGDFHLGRDKRAGVREGHKTPPHRADSIQNRFARWKALTQ